MLYPDLNDLIAFKCQKSKFTHRSDRFVKSRVPGNHHSPFRGQGLEFESVREYVIGDDIRSIDWRVTARTGAPHLKLFKEERERHIIICVDMNRSMRYGTRKTFKSVQAARVAALLGWRGLAQHDFVSACLFGDVRGRIHLFPPKKSNQSFCTLLKMLTEPCSPGPYVAINEALQSLIKVSHTGSLIYLISDFMDIDKSFEYEEGLNCLNKRCDLVFISINDQADQSIHPMGSIKFQVTHAEKATINTDSIAGRMAYAAMWKDNRRQLHATASKFKIPLVELSTESDVAADLFVGMKTIAKRKSR